MGWGNTQSGIKVTYIQNDIRKVGEKKEREGGGKSLVWDRTTNLCLDLLDLSRPHLVTFLLVHMYP